MPENYNDYSALTTKQRNLLLHFKLKPNRHCKQAHLKLFKQLMKTESDKTSLFNKIQQLTVPQIKAIQIFQLPLDNVGNWSESRLETIKYIAKLTKKTIAELLKEDIRNDDLRNQIFITLLNRNKETDISALLGWLNTLDFCPLERLSLLLENTTHYFPNVMYILTFQQFLEKKPEKSIKPVTLSHSHVAYPPPWPGFNQWQECAISELKLPKHLLFGDVWFNSELHFTTLKHLNRLLYDNIEAALLVMQKIHFIEGVAQLSEEEINKIPRGVVIEPQPANNLNVTISKQLSKYFNIQEISLAWWFNSETHLVNLQYMINVLGYKPLEALAATRYLPHLLNVQQQRALEYLENFGATSQHFWQKNWFCEDRMVVHLYYEVMNVLRENKENPSSIIKLAPSIIKQSIDKTYTFFLPGPKPDTHTKVQELENPVQCQQHSAGQQP